MERLLEVNKEISECYAQSAADIISHFQNDECDPMLTRLRREYEKCCEIEEKFKIESNIAPRLLSSYEEERVTADDWSKLLKEYKTEVAGIVTDVSNHENLKEFDRIVQELKEAEGQDANDEEDDNGELKVTRNPTNIIDPVTKKRMTDPVRNMICTHIYDRTSVAALLKMNPNSLCPVPGCKSKEPLKMIHMKTDFVTKTYLLKHPA